MKSITARDIPDAVHKKLTTQANKWARKDGKIRSYNLSAYVRYLFMEATK